jgi:hypothetical protein
VTMSPEERERWKIRNPPQQPAKIDAHYEPGDAPCRVCGGAVGAQGARYWGPWREHTGCGRLATYGAARVAACARKLAVASLTTQDAGLVGASVPNYCDVPGMEPVYSGGRMRDRMAWRHVNVRALRRAVKGLPEARRRAGLDESGCTLGACAWCGIRRARGKWHESPYRWRDGRPAPFCSDCYATWQSCESPEVGDDLARAWLVAITGVPRRMDQSRPEVVLPYVTASDDREGVPDRWAYLAPEVLDGIRLPEWGRDGGRYAPAERRAEAVAAYAATADGEQARQMGEAVAQLTAKRKAEWWL